MRLKDYGYWVEVSSITSPGQWKKEYGNESLSSLIMQDGCSLKSDLYYSIISFYKHSKLMMTMRVDATKSRYSILVEKYDPNPELETDLVIHSRRRSCKKDKLIEKLLELVDHKWF